MTDRRNGPWIVHETETAFSNPWIKVESSRITHPDGSAGTYGVVRFANIAAGVLPIDRNGMTWIVGQHRFPFDAYSWELPEGGGGTGADPWKAAARELAEETGLRARQHAEIGCWHISNSVTDEVAYGFLAWDLEQGEASPEPSEELDVRQIAFAELVGMLRSGEIRDSFTHLMVWNTIDMARRGALPPEISGFLLSG